MNKKRTALLVGTLAVALSIGAAGIIMSTGVNDRLAISALDEPLVLDVVKDTVRNGDAHSVVTERGTTLEVDSKLEDNKSKPGWYSLRSFANIDRIGNIKGINMEFNGGPTPAAFKLSWGYEADVDGNPIYVKTGYILPEDGINPKKLNFAFASVTATNPNFFKMELRQATWAAAPIKTLQVLYGTKTGIGDGACIASQTPAPFKGKAVIDFTDPMKTDVDMKLDTLYNEGKKDVGSYTVKLENLKKADKFFIKLGDKVADAGDISLLKDFLVKNSDNSISVLQNIDGNTSIAMEALMDGSLTAKLEIAGKVYVPKDFYIFGHFFVNNSVQYWNRIDKNCVYNGDQTYTWEGLQCIGGAAPTEFVFKTTANESYEIPVTLYDTPETIAYVAGKAHIVIAADGTYDITLKDTGEAISAKIVASAPAA